jgi:hypothetical protein
MALGRKTKGAIDPSTPISEFLVCKWALLGSAAGSCNVGTVVHRSDPRVALAPEAFSPVLNTLDVRER